MKPARLKTAKDRTPSSQAWLSRQINDPFAAKARAHGYRSRAAYQLSELDDKLKLLKPGVRVIDLGLALLLVRNLESLSELSLNGACNCCVDVLLVVKEAWEVSGFLRGLRREFLLGYAQSTNEGLCSLETLSNNFFGWRLSAFLDEVEGVVSCFCLDHHDRDVVACDASGNHHVKDRAGLL